MKEIRTIKPYNEHDPAELGWDQFSHLVATAIQRREQAMERTREGVANGWISAALSGLPEHRDYAQRPTTPVKTYDHPEARERYFRTKLNTAAEVA